MLDLLFTSFFFAGGKSFSTCYFAYFLVLSSSWLSVVSISLWAELFIHFKLSLLGTEFQYFALARIAGTGLEIRRSLQKEIRTTKQKRIWMSTVYVLEACFNFEKKYHRCRSKVPFSRHCDRWDPTPCRLDFKSDVWVRQSRVVLGHDFQISVAVSVGFLSVSRNDGFRHEKTPT